MIQSLPLRETVTLSAPTRTPWTRTTNVADPVASGGFCAAPSVVAERSATLRWPKSRFVNDIADQYRTITEGAGWIDRSARGRLRFDGADATAFLQAQLTN